jgi:hypothetical protein
VDIKLLDDINSIKKTRPIKQVGVAVEEEGIQEAYMFMLGHQKNHAPMYR